MLQVFCFNYSYCEIQLLVPTNFLKTLWNIILAYKIEVCNFNFKFGMTHIKPYPTKHKILGPLWLA
jgi:hypothetical protein